MKDLVNVKVEYFKPSGKYYSDGNFSVDKNLNVFDASQVFKNILRLGRMPGLSGFEKDFTIYIGFQELNQGYPVLIKAKDHLPDISLRQACLYLLKYSELEMIKDPEFEITLFLSQNNVYKLLKSENRYSNEIEKEFQKFISYKILQIDTDDIFKNITILFNCNTIFKTINIENENDLLGSVKLKNTDMSITFTSLELF